MIGVGLLLVVVGFGIIALGTAQQGNSSAGGFVLIGPFPIVFGTGPNGGTLAFLSVILGVVMVVALLVTAFRFRSISGKKGE